MKVKCENCQSGSTISCSYYIIDGTRGYLKYINEIGESHMPLCRKCYKELLDITEKVKQKDTSIIPEGPYCYTPIGHNKNGYNIKPCPYFDTIKNGEHQNDGYCHFLEEGDTNLDGSDREGGFGLLWDQCKNCGINNEDDMGVSHLLI